MAVITYYFVLSITILLFYKRIIKFIPNKIIFLIISFGLLYVPYYIIFHHGIRDVELYESVGYLSRHRVDIYYQDADHRLWPYFPFINFSLGILYEVSRHIQVHFINLWRLITLSSLLVCAFFVEKILRENKFKNSYKKTALFIFSPLSVWPVVYHAHPDVFVSTFYIIAIYLIYYRKNKWLLGYVSLGFSILAKTWSLVFVPLFLILTQDYSKTLLRHIK